MYTRDPDIHGTKVYLGSKPYKFIGFGDIHGPNPYKFIGFGDSPAPRSKLSDQGIPWVRVSGSKTGFFSDQFQSRITPSRPGMTSTIGPDSFRRKYSYDTLSNARVCSLYLEGPWADISAPGGPGGPGYIRLCGRINLPPGGHTRTQGRRYPRPGPPGPPGGRRRKPATESYLFVVFVFVLFPGFLFIYIEIFVFIFVF